jgi:hypothetical protein
MKARRFGKALASFLSLPYLNRGKQAKVGDETWLVVVEDHGNPRGLVKRSPGKEENLTFRLSGEPELGLLKKCVPVVMGAGALPIAQFFELEWVESSASHQTRVLSVASDRIDFVDMGEAKFRLKI